MNTFKGKKDRERGEEMGKRIRIKVVKKRGYLRGCLAFDALAQPVT